MRMSVNQLSDVGLFQLSRSWKLLAIDDTLSENTPYTSLLLRRDSNTFGLLHL